MMADALLSILGGLLGCGIGAVVFFPDILAMYIKDVLAWWRT